MAHQQDQDGRGLGTYRYPDYDALSTTDFRLGQSLLSGIRRCCERTQGYATSKESEEFERQ